MNIEEVIAKSKLLKKAIRLGIVLKRDDGYYCIKLSGLFIYITLTEHRVLCPKKGYWVTITSVKQVEQAFKQELLEVSR